MTDTHSLNTTDFILPALPQVARLVQRKGSVVRDDLRPLLSSTGIIDEWAVDELEQWAAILSSVRGQTDSKTLNEAMHHLMRRGVPQAPAHLAVAEVSSAAKPTVTNVILPIRLSQQEINFGELLPGKEGKTTIIVSGGPGQVSCEADMVTVSPEQFGPQPTAITVTVKGGSEGQMVWGPLVFESSAERTTVEVNARWLASAVPLSPVDGLASSYGTNALPTDGQAGPDVPIVNVPPSHNDPSEEDDSPQGNLAPHTPWLERPHAERRLFFKLFLVAVVVALSAIASMFLLRNHLVQPSSNNHPSGVQSSH